MLDTIHASQDETVHTQVYQMLRRSLMSGRFRPGQPISIRYLTEQLTVSATPVREALKRLEADSALVKGPNRALMVPILKRGDLRDLRDIRIALEGLAVERGVERMTEPEIAEAAHFCGEMDKATRTGDADVYLASNWGFHRAIYQAARSALLMSMIENLWVRVGPFFRLSLSDVTHMTNSMVSHFAALEALRRRQPKAAREAIEADIGGAAADLEKLLPE
jgi:DNA-binding GntR family transcriptional regulator